MRRLFFTTALLCAAIVTAGYGQSKVDTLVAREYLNSGIDFFRKAQYDSALNNYLKSKALFEETDNWGGHISVLNRLAEVYWRMSKLDSAFSVAEKSMELNDKHIGNDNENKAFIYGILGTIYRQKGNYNTAEEYYRSSLEIREKLYPPNHPLIAMSIRFMGIINGIRNNYAAALVYLKRSLEIARGQFGDQSLPVGQSYSMMSLASSRLGNMEEAIEYAKKSVAITKTLFNHNHPAAGLFLLNLGNTYGLNGQYDSAKLVLERAVLILNRFTPNSENSAKALLNLAGANSKMGNYVDASRNYKEAAGILLKNFGDKYAELAAVYSSWGKNYESMGKADSALYFMQKGLMANIFDFSNNDIHVTPDIKNFIDFNRLLWTLVEKLETLYNVHNLRKEGAYLNTALRTVQAADSLVLIMRKKRLGDQDQVVLSTRVNKLYKLASLVCIQLFHKSDDKKYIEDALYYSSKSKAGVLRANISENSDMKYAGVPDSLIAYEQELKKRLSFFGDRNAESSSENETDMFDQVSQEYEQLTGLLETNFPRYYQLKYGNQSNYLSGIQSQLNDNSLLLDYLIAEDSIYVFQIDRTSINLSALKRPADLLPQIDSMRKSLISNSMSPYGDAASVLYDYLLRPLAIDDSFESLIIIPDEELWHVNFDLLLTDMPKSENIIEFPYLVRNYGIIYLNSLSMLGNINDESENLNNGQCLAFAYGDSTLSGSGAANELRQMRSISGDLPGSRKELQYISQTLDGQYYIGNKANEANFKIHSEGYSILHLALHGELDEKDPYNSRLIFTQTKDTLEDDFLYGRELYAMDLPADMAVLSACNSGAGELSKGEGIRSLGRAFQYAGTKSILLGAWEVSDAITPELMKYFYEALDRGETKSQALRYAKLSFLNNDADNFTSSPYYWGSFYLVGDNSSIKFNRQSTWIYYFAIAAGVILLIYFIRKRNLRVS